MARFDGFKIVCTNCGNDDQDMIECTGVPHGITLITCRVCDKESEDMKYSWQENTR